MNKILLIVFCVILTFFTACIVIVDERNIVNDDILNIFNLKASSSVVKNYSIDDVVILPHFANDNFKTKDIDKNIFSFYLMAETNDASLEYIVLNEYSLTISDEAGKKFITKKLDKKFKMDNSNQRYSEDKWWFINADNKYRLIATLFNGEYLPVDKESKIVLIISITVKTKDKEETKQLTIPYNYKKTKHPVLLT